LKPWNSIGNRAIAAVVLALEAVRLAAGGLADDDHLDPDAAQAVDDDSLEEQVSAVLSTYSRGRFSCGSAVPRG
jgi:hypothetical protein